MQAMLAEDASGREAMTSHAKIIAYGLAIAGIFSVAYWLLMSLLRDWRQKP